MSDSQTTAADPLDKLVEQMAGPSRAGKKEVTYEEFQKMLDSTPLFMQETPEDSDDPVLAALKGLVFDGEGDEVAINFKNHGNELYVQKSYRDAIDAYTSGLEAGPTTSELRISLLNNRAACHLALKNHGSALRDTGTIIALCIREQTLPPIKALYRSGQSLVALERWVEALDVIQRGRQYPGEGDKAEWVKLEASAESGKRRVMERIERDRRARLDKAALKQAIESRGVIVVNTPTPPDNPNPLHFAPDSIPAPPPLYPLLPDTPYTPPPSHTPLVYPVFLLYPQYGQSDLITHFDETTSFNEQLSVMFPSSPTPSGNWAEWDEKNEYWNNNLVVYVETANKRLLKIGKELSLTEVLAKGVKQMEDGKMDGVTLQDGLLSFVALPKGEQEKKWINEYKSKRDQGR